MPVLSAFRVFILVFVLQATWAAASGAQRVPRRPKLPAGADTNDANTYYQYGVQVVRRNPGNAAQAFYWAHRLSPDWPDPLYGQWVASLLSRSNRLPEYLNGERGVVKSKEYRAIDSLYYAALALNPFLYRRFDRMLFDEYIEVYARRYESRTGQTVNRGLLQHEFDQDVMSDPALRGWMTYAQGMWDQAIAAYTQALKGAKYKAGLLASRARAAFLKGDYAAALADMTAALEDRRQIEDEDLVFFYDSKALFEHSIGVVHEMLREPAAAREAYARALQEDLSYHQGHIRMAALALAARDTVTAISEYDLAVQLRPNDPVARYQLGALLSAGGRHDEAVDHFKAAIEAEPAYAPPYSALGRSYEALSRPADALVQYQAFIAHAPRNEAGLPHAQRRVEALSQESRP